MGCAVSMGLGEMVWKLRVWNVSTIWSEKSGLDCFLVYSKWLSGTTFSVLNHAPFLIECPTKLAKRWVKWLKSYWTPSWQLYAQIETKGCQTAKYITKWIRVYSNQVYQHKSPWALMSISGWSISITHHEIPNHFTSTLLYSPHLLSSRFPLLANISRRDNDEYANNS